MTSQRSACVGTFIFCLRVLSISLGASGTSSAFAVSAVLVVFIRLDVSGVSDTSVASGVFVQLDMSGVLDISVASGVLVQLGMSGKLSASN